MKPESSNKPKIAMRRLPTLESGFTMIEVLIAFLVLAIGLIGMASLQLTSVKSAHSSYFRSIASSIALDLEEHLWLEVANRTVAGCPEPDNVVTRIQEIWSGTGTDGNTWTTNELAALPGIGLDGAIISNVTEATELTPEGTPFWTEISFTLEWSEERFEGDNGTEQFDFTGRVACRPAPETI